MSTSPVCRRLYALAMASVEDAHADTAVRTPPRAAMSIPTAAAGPFGISMGTVIGRTRRGPRSFRVSNASRSVQTPPIPVENSTARRSGATSGLPASAQASRAEISANWLDGSRRFTSCGVSTSAEATAAWPAKVTGTSYCAIHSFSIVEMPDSPASKRSQVVLTSPPRGVVAPIPVTTIFFDTVAIPECD